MIKDDQRNSKAGEKRQQLASDFEEDLVLPHIVCPAGLPGATAFAISLPVPPAHQPVTPPPASPLPYLHSPQQKNSSESLVSRLPHFPSTVAWTESLLSTLLEPPPPLHL